MIRIAIAEDEKEHADALAEHVERFAREMDTPVDITRFDNAVTMLENYKAAYDLIFLDIKMPYMNGIDAAHRLRELDNDVMLIFVTSMRQYALEGYSVNAFDFIVKPVTYADFQLKMSRAFKQLKNNANQSEIMLSTENGLIKVRAADIRYVETDGHNIIYRIIGGNDIVQYSSLKAVEARLEKYGFARCNSCYLVNLRYVKSVKGFTVDVGDTELQISQPRRKKFIQSMIEYVEKASKV